MQFINLFFRGLIGSLTLTLVACTTPVTPDFSAMSAKYANIVEQYQINAILINIARASHNRPLSFLDIPSITGSGSVSNAVGVNGGFAGVAASNIAGGLATGSMSLGLAFGNSFNFTQSSLNNSTFTTEFLSEIPPSTMKYFTKTHMPKELLFSVLVDSIEYVKPDGSTQVFINNPLMPDYPKFQEQMYRLLKHGLSIERGEGVPVGSPMTDAQLKIAYGQNYVGYLKNHNMMVKGVATSNREVGKQEPLFQVVGADSSYRLCIKDNEFTNFIRNEFQADTFCKNPVIADTSSVKRNELIINRRSTYDAFVFLGQVLKAQTSISNPYIVTIKPSAGTLNFSEEELNRYALLIVKKNDDDSESFAKVTTVDGDIYSIPRHNNGYSSLVINFMNQLLTLNKIPGSIPPSPAVLIR